MAGKIRPYRTEEVRSLAGLLGRQWPGVFVAEGDGYELDRFRAKSLGVVVWMKDVTVSLPGDGSVLVMVPRRFDDGITLKCVAKRLRRAARQKFDPTAPPRRNVNAC